MTRSFSARGGIAAVAVLGVAAAAAAGEVSYQAGGYRFDEHFRWQGNHAATIGSAPNYATTVWWDEASWDTRCDTTFIAVEPVHDDGIDMTNAFHVDIHKAASSDPHSGVIDNTVYALGGDGSPGIGIMHLDYQDICSARLRNPMLVQAAQPGVVTFYAPAFNTTGHWWEIAITPANSVVGAEHTSVPSVDSGLPFPDSNVDNPGPGHGPPPADSINLVSIGSADAPCVLSTGWRTRFGVSKTVAGNETHYVTQGVTQADYLAADPSTANTLVRWQISYATDHISLSADLAGNGTLTALESWPVSVPWSEVNVHLMAVGYQSSHHPQAPCNLGHIRELQWREVSVYPVKYARTDVFPKNSGVTHTPMDLGFSAYDIRDIQRLGTVNGVPQANAGAFNSQHPGKYCADAGFPCFGSTSTTPTLAFSLPQGAVDNLAALNLVADMKDAAGASHVSASATLNAQPLGRLPEHDAVPTVVGTDWVRRALAGPPAALHAGANSLQLALEPGAYMDRIELELMYIDPDRIFADNFEAVAPRTPGKSHVNPQLGRLQLSLPRAPVGSGAHLLHQCSD